MDRIEELKNKNTKLQDTVSQLEETNKNDIFEKNKECGLLRNEIKDELFDPQYTFGILDPQIEEIFYSQKKNSCLYIFSYRKPACE